MSFDSRLPMGDPLGELVEIASPALGNELTRREEIPEQLTSLLDRRNGFYAFEGALHVRPDRTALAELGLESWNSDSLWRSHYGNLADGHFFFAEDIFGGQFSLTATGIYAWDPETADAEFLAKDMTGWATMILAEYPLLTGHRLAHEWQAAYGPLALGYRLLPMTPFVLGGSFTLENLRAFQDVEAMRVRGPIAHRLKELPDGTSLTLRYVE